MQGESKMAQVREASANGTSLAGQVVIVTGGSGGLGRAIVRKLGQLGADVGIVFRDHEESARDAVEELRTQGRNAYAHRADVRHFGKVSDAIASIREELGEVTGIVNNAGVVRDKALMLMESDEWCEVIDTNLTGVFNVCRASIVSMMKQKQGRIVNVSSVAGIQGSARQVNYSASKAGIIGLSRALAKEVAGYGITVNCIAPGYIATGMVSRLDPAQQRKALERIPLGRFGDAWQVADLVGYLLSDSCSYVTGQTIVVDGGLSL